MSITQEPRAARTVSGLMTFLMICLFAGLSLLLVVIGARVYRSVADTSANNAAVRSTVHYVCGKIRSRGAQDRLYVTQLSGCDALAIEADYDGELYTTYIYCMDGALRELFMSQDAEITAEDGARLADIASFAPSLTEEMCAFTVESTDGAAYTQHVALRGEGAP